MSTEITDEKLNDLLQNLQVHTNLDLPPNFYQKLHSIEMHPKWNKMNMVWAALWAVLGSYVLNLLGSFIFSTFALWGCIILCALYVLYVEMF